MVTPDRVSAHGQPARLHVLAKTSSLAIQFLYSEIYVVQVESTLPFIMESFFGLGGLHWIPKCLLHFEYGLDKVQAC
jgi:hypothetical protein